MKYFNRLFDRNWSYLEQCLFVEGIRQEFDDDGNWEYNSIKIGEWCYLYVNRESGGVDKGWAKYRINALRNLSKLPGLINRTIWEF